MLHTDEGENPVSINSLVAMKTASHAQQNSSKKIPRPISSISTWAAQLTKIVKNEAGAMWLKDPDKIYSIIDKVQSVLDIPLTVKMRTGWSDPSLAAENALAAEAAGVLCSHHAWPYPRTNVYRPRRPRDLARCSPSTD